MSIPAKYGFIGQRTARFSCLASALIFTAIALGIALLSCRCFLLFSAAGLLLLFHLFYLQTFYTAFHKYTVIIIPDLCIICQSRLSIAAPYLDGYFRKNSQLPKIYFSTVRTVSPTDLELTTSSALSGRSVMILSTPRAIIFCISLCRSTVHTNILLPL